MSAYGNMLTAFPELLRHLSVFKMEKTNFAWGKRYAESDVYGYIQKSEKGGIGDYEGAVEDEDGATLYVNGNGALETGSFVEGLDGEIWRIVEHDGYAVEGQFSEYRLRRLVSLGNDKNKDEEVDDVVRNSFV